MCLCLKIGRFESGSGERDRRGKCLFVFAFLYLYISTLGHLPVYKPSCIFLGCLLENMALVLDT